MQPLVKARFAPTPSGFLHLGNAFSFVLTWLIARQRGGRILLRIDDIDPLRSRPAYVEDVFYCLESLGLDYDEGPSGPEDFMKNRSQRLFLDQYEQILQSLKNKGFLFACTCSRKQTGGTCEGTCLHKNLPFDTLETAWRVNNAQSKEETLYEPEGRTQILPHFEAMPFWVIRTKQGEPAYQLVSVVEDVKHGINLIVRGQDLLSSSAAQTWLARQLPSLSAFGDARFVHHPLCLDTAGQKLSKSNRAPALRELTKNRTERENLFVYFSKLLNLPPCKEAASLLRVFAEKHTALPSIGQAPSPPQSAGAL